jgi:hypothetical protein
MVAVIVSVAVLGLVGSSRAQGYDLSWHTIDGGGSASSGAQFQLVGTIGQADAGGPLNGGGFALRGGFWPGVGPAAASTPTPTGATPSTPTPTSPATVTATPTVPIGVVTPTPTITPTPTAVTTPIVPPTPTAAATPSIDVASVRKCQVAIAKSSTAFVHTKLAALQQCEAKIVAGKLSGACPDGDPKTTQKIADALQKLRDGIAKACGGKNKMCSAKDNGVDADIPRTAIGFPPLCPGFEGGCSNAIADRDCGDIATCLGCIDEAAVDQAIALYYDGTPADPKAAKALNACQQAIGKNAVKLFTARSKALLSCWGKVIDGKMSGPCPDAAKAGTAIAKATSQFEAAIGKACCGKNKTCNLADSGVNLDFDPGTAIGFRPTCESVTVPEGPSCDAAITDVQSLMTCLGCVTEFKADCVSAAQLPAFVMPYPAVCE